MALLTEDDVRRIIDERLSDPLTLPREFKSWVPSFTEVSGIQLPIGQIVGTYVVASTVAGLGPGVHGRTGVIRGGATPYDFLKVTYDQVYGKWTSDPIPMGHGTAGFALQTIATGYITVPGVSAQSIMPWRTWDTAGLAPQMRLKAGLRITPAGTVTMTIRARSMDFNSVTVNSSDQAWTITSTNTGGTYERKDSGWQDLAGLTLADTIDFIPLVKVNLAANTGAVQEHAVILRWVSK